MRRVRRPRYARPAGPPPAAVAADTGTPSVERLADDEAPAVEPAREHEQVGARPRHASALAIDAAEARPGRPARVPPPALPRRGARRRHDVEGPRPSARRPRASTSRSPPLRSMHVADEARTGTDHQLVGRGRSTPGEVAVRVQLTRGSRPVGSTAARREDRRAHDAHEANDRRKRRRSSERQPTQRGPHAVGRAVLLEDAERRPRRCASTRRHRRTGSARARRRCARCRRDARRAVARSRPHPGRRPARRRRPLRPRGTRHGSSPLVELLAHHPDHVDAVGPGQGRDVRLLHEGQHVLPDDDPHGGGCVHGIATGRRDGRSGRSCGRRPPSGWAPARSGGPRGRLGPAGGPVRRSSLRRTLARRSQVSSLMTYQPGSISNQRWASLADVGAAWWLLCRPSPAVMNASHCRLPAELSYGRRPKWWPMAFTAAEPPRYRLTCTNAASRPTCQPNTSDEGERPRGRGRRARGRRTAGPAGSAGQVLGVAGHRLGVVRLPPVHRHVLHLHLDPAVQDRGVRVALDVGEGVVLAVHRDPLARADPGRHPDHEPERLVRRRGAASAPGGPAPGAGRRSWPRWRGARRRCRWPARGGSSAASTGG